jgi:hypothetical protein
MKKTVVLCILLFIFALPCIAGINAELFDLWSPLPYNGKPLDKMTLGYYTYQDTASGGDQLFENHFIVFGMPLAPADIRVELMSPKGSNTKNILIGTVFPLVFASLQAGYMTQIGGSGTPYQELDLNLIFSNTLFNWGIGLDQDLTNSQSYPTLKIAKGIDVGFANVEAKASYYQNSSTGNETDLMVKAMFSVLPIYAGVTNAQISGSTNTYFMLGALFNL